MDYLKIIRKDIWRTRCFENLIQTDKDIFILEKILFDYASK